MTLATYDFLGTVSVHDTATLTVFLTINGQKVTNDQILGVSFTVQKPDLTESTVVGTVQPDGSGTYLWTDTTLVGEYLVQAQFSLVSSEKRSVMTNFNVIDPFKPPVPSGTDLITEQVLLRLEDCFDSVEGGPWLKDKSMAHFDGGKIAAFIPEALLDINVQMPPTNLDIGTFTAWGTTPGDNPSQPLLVKGVLILTIKHLMRSYTEQPVPAGGQVVWHDRTRYQEMWNRVYQVEYADYIQAVRLWKRTFLRLGQSGLLTLSKAGRLYPYGSMRSRGISRGYF